VHPQYQGRGIGTCLVRLGEQRARQQAALPPWTAQGRLDWPSGQAAPVGAAPWPAWRSHLCRADRCRQDGQVAPPGLRVSLYNSVNHANEAARKLVEGEGYTLARHFWRMQMDMDEAPQRPVWPDGITVRTFVPGQDEPATFEAFQEAFRDHWEYVPWRFETWQQIMIERDDFDPSLWFLAMDGDEIAGGSLCFNHHEEGWVDDLAVRRPWRRQGLGLALLRHSFRELYRRAQRRVALGVDTQNTTGATRLYDRAGMHVSRQYDAYHKELRPGRDPG